MRHPKCFGISALSVLSTAFLMSLLLTLPVHAQNVLSHINGVDLYEEPQHQGVLNLYVHTDSPVRHHAVREGSQVILDLYDTVLTASTFAVHYEKAPSVQGVRVKQLGEHHIQLAIEGSHLESPIVGFRELNGVTTTPFRIATAAVPTKKKQVPPVISLPKQKEGNVFLAIESSEAEKIPKEIKMLSAKKKASSLTVSPLLEDDPSIANMPTAIESDVLLEETLDEREEATAPTGIRQTAKTLALLLAQWSKAHSTWLLGILVISASLWMLLSKLKPTKSFSTKAFNLDPRLQDFRSSAPSVGMSEPSLFHSAYAHAPVKPSQHNTLERLREKMKQSGDSFSPQGVSHPYAETHPAGVNLKVKEAIARKQAERYGKPLGVTQSLMTAETPTSQAEGVSGNAFLHAMAQHMDTNGKENIAKAIQQNKPYY